jgi:hypothetical protein
MSDYVKLPTKFAVMVHAVSATVGNFLESGHMQAALGVEKAMLAKCPRCCYVHRVPLVVDGQTVEIIKRELEVLQHDVKNKDRRIAGLKEALAGYQRAAINRDLDHIYGND